MYTYLFGVFIINSWFLLANSAGVEAESYKIDLTVNRTWDEAIALAKEFVAKMTLEEKCNMTSGVRGPCTGYISPVPRLNFTGLCLQDAASGVAGGVLFSTVFPPGIHVAATWDRNLFYQRAAAIGQEFRGKGIHFALGPVINLARLALHGRNWEAFGADPYLTGENAFSYVQGIQDQGVVVTAKHYICNEQETHRHFYSGTDALSGYSSHVDDKTTHELYLWPFFDSVAAGSGAVMCAYNGVNGSQACQNNETLNGLLKGELGFQGMVMSDWQANDAGIRSALAGLDIDMPGTDRCMGYSLLPAVQNGSIPEAKINDMVVRILAPYFLLGQDQNYPPINPNHEASGDHHLINREVGTAGMILLKNTKNTLPFNTSTEKFYLIYGSAASRQIENINPNTLDGIDGAIYEGGGSGYVRPTTYIDPLSAFLAKANDDHLQLQYYTDQDDYATIKYSLSHSGFHDPHCLVFINAFSKEGVDRQNLSAYHDGDKLVKTVAADCPSTIVIVNSVAHLNLEAWVDNPQVTAILWSGLPGTQYGLALVDILFGNYNPGGKLVFTLAKNDSDYGTNITETPVLNYTEGIFLDYRHFEKYNITPRYHFGYGLSYTTFSFSSLIISEATGRNSMEQAFYRRRRMSPYMNKALSEFYDPVYNITFTIKNTGNVNGSEVAQLYLAFPAEANEPAKILRGFERIYLAAGESKTVTLPLTQRDIAYWNVVNQKWTVAPGKYTVYISTSANNADIKLQSSFNI